VLTFSQAWRHVCLSWWLLLAPPVICFMGGDSARGVELTPGGVPNDTQPGAFIDRGGGISGYYGYRVVIGEGYFEFLVAPPSAYVGRVPVPTGTLVWHLPNLEADELDAATMASANTHAGALGQYYGKEWFRDAVLDPEVGSAAWRGLKYDKDGGIANESIVEKYIREGWGWDMDGDDDVDADDYEDMFDGDMDNDEIPDADDWDIDGDGEPNQTEMDHGPVGPDDPRAYLDHLTGMDRDLDTLPDLLDHDADGVPNWVETELGYDPEDALSVPEGGVWFTGQPDGPYTEWIDTDHDGAWDWLEGLAGSNPNDVNSIPDKTDNGVWDWGVPSNKILFANLPITPPGSPGPTPPENPTPGSNPIAPILVNGGGSMAGAPASGSAGGAAGDGESQGNTVDGTGNPGASTGGGENPVPGAGEGGEGGEGEGIGRYIVQEYPRGNSTAYLGVGGGSWQQRAGPNSQYYTGTTHDAVLTKADVLVNAIRGVQVVGAEGHVITFPIKWFDGTAKNFSIPLLPNTSTEWGAIAEQVRIFLRSAAIVFVTYVLIRSVWLVLRQY